MFLAFVAAVLSLLSAERGEVSRLLLFSFIMEMAALFKVERRCFRAARRCPFFVAKQASRHIIAATKRYITITGCAASTGEPPSPPLIDVD